MPRFCSDTTARLTGQERVSTVRRGQNEMKTLNALLLSFFLMAAGAFAQQQPSSSQQESQLASTSKAVKKAKSKKKSKRAQKEVAGETEQESLPPLLSERLKKFSQTVPEDGGLSNPGGLAHQEFMHRAYPGTTIPADRIEGARAGHAAMAGKNFSNDTLGPWQTFGPSYALYPFTPLRSFESYIPNAYPAASRTTAMALSSHCQTDKCTLWVGPAGGGVWRAGEANGGHPHGDNL